MTVKGSLINEVRFTESAIMLHNEQSISSIVIKIMAQYSHLALEQAWL